MVLLPTLIAVFECIVHMPSNMKNNYDLKIFNQHLSNLEEKCYKSDIPDWISTLNNTNCNLEKPMCKGEFKGTKCWMPRCDLGIVNKTCSFFVDSSGEKTTTSHDPIWRECTGYGWLDEHDNYENSRFIVQEAICMGVDAEEVKNIEELETWRSNNSDSLVYDDTTLGVDDYFYDDNFDQAYEKWGIKTDEEILDMEMNGLDYAYPDPIIIDKSKNQTLEKLLEPEKDCPIWEGPLVCFLHNHLHYLYLISGISCFIAILIYSCMPKLLSPRSIVHINLFVVFLIKSIVFPLKYKHIIYYSDELHRRMVKQHEYAHGNDTFNQRPYERHKIIVEMHETVEESLKKDVFMCQLLDFTNIYFEFTRSCWILMASPRLRRR